MDVIEFDSTSKSYGRVRALDSVSWRVARGRLMGFLGPNGAGKTTAIRILLGFLKASSGRARVFGMDAWRSSTRIRRRVGYLPGDIRLYTNMTGLQTVRYVGHARGRGGDVDAGRLAEVFELDLRRPVRGYSKGMRQKLGLILAMMHRPELLILDEPSSGLDPLMQQVMQQELRAATDDGRTVLFSSHSLPEVEQLCEDVVILRQGKVVADERIESLRKRAGYRVTLCWPSSEAATEQPPEGFSVERSGNGTMRGRWRGDVDVLTQWLAGQRLKEVTIEPPDLEDLFIDYYGPPGKRSA